MRNTVVLTLAIIGILLVIGKLADLKIENTQLKQKQNESTTSICRKEYERGYVMGWLSQKKKLDCPCTITIPPPTESCKGGK